LVERYFKDILVKRDNASFALKDILPKVIEKLSAGNIHKQIHIENAWSNVIGLDAIGSAYSGFKNGCVIITVDTPERLYQLKLKRPTILRRLKELCPEVKNISFKIGKVK